MPADRMKILVIGGDQDNLVTLKAQINEALPEVLTLMAFDAESGLKLAAAEKPDVILLDSVIPGMDGVEVCRELKTDKVLCDIPVIFVTALKGSRSSRIHALDCGAEAFIYKPVDEVELTAQIRAMFKIRTANTQIRYENDRPSALTEMQMHTFKDTYLATLNLMDDLHSENEARKISEEALRRSESKYRLLLTNIPDVSWTANSLAETIYVSGKIKNIIGFSYEEIVKAGSSFWIDTIHPDDATTVKEAFDLLFKRSRKFDKEFRLRKKDGAWVWVNVRASKVYEKDGCFFSDGILTDINSRRQLQDKNRDLDREILALYSIGSRLNSTTDSSEVCSYILFQLNNMMKIDRSYIYLQDDSVGLKLKTSLGITGKVKDALKSLPITIPWVKKVLSGKHVKSKGLIPLDLPEAAGLSETAAGISAWCAVPLKIGSEVIGLLLVAHNTEKNYSQRELFLLNSISNQLAVLIENHSLYEKMQNKNLELERSREDLRKNLKKISRANVELERLNVAKSNFVGIASHELNTPITSIYCSLQYLDLYSDLVMTSEQQEIMDSVKEGIIQIKELVEDLLCISRIEASHMPIQKAPLDLLMLSREIASSLSVPLSSRKIRIDFTGEEGLLCGNESLCRMAVRNLLDNAIKFTPDGGCITVRGRYVAKEEALGYKKTLRSFYPKFPLKTDVLDCYYRLDVQDTGIGIPSDELTRIFAKFYGVGDISHHSSGKTGFMSKGSGLGLSIVKGAMSAHNGFVWVTADPDGTGSIFSLLFPLNC